MVSCQWRLNLCTSVFLFNVCRKRKLLVGGLEHEFYDFPYIGNFIIPTDFHSILFQRGLLAQPPTRYIKLWKTYITIVFPCQKPSGKHSRYTTLNHQPETVTLVVWTCLWCNSLVPLKVDQWKIFPSKPRGPLYISHIFPNFWRSR